MGFLKQHRLPLSSLLVLAPLCYAQWFSRALPQYNDLGYLNNPQRDFVQMALHHGQMPFWNPLSFGGQAFFAAGQSGPLYLPNLLFVLLPLAWFIKLVYLLHFELIAIGMYLLSFRFTQSKRASVLSAVSFLTCGYLLGHQVHTQMFDAIAWLPLLLWGALRLFDRWSVPRFVLVGSIYAGVVYAGQPQMSFFVALFVGLFIVLTGLFEKKLVSALTVLFGLLLGLGLSAPQWFPTLQLTLHSSRSFTPSFLLAGTMTARDFLQFLFPFVTDGFFGSSPLYYYDYQTAYHQFWSFWEYMCFIGAIPLILALFALSGVRLKRRDHVFVLAIMFVFFVLLTTGWSVTNALLVHVPGFDLFRIPARYLALVDFTLCLLAGVGFTKLGKASKYQTVCLVCVTSALIVLGILTSVLHWLPLSALAFWVAMIPLFAFLLMLFTDGRVLVTLVFSSVLLFQVLWSVSMNRFILQYPLPAVPKLVSYLHAHLSGPYPFYRILDETYAMIADENILYNLPAVTGYDSLVSQYASAVTVSQSDLDKLDVQFIITSPGHPLPTNLKGWAAVYSTEGYAVYRNPDQLHAANIADAHLVHYAYNHETWRVHVAHAWTLRLSQVYDPGWHANVDGNPVQVSAVDGFLTGVLVPKGSHTITLTYVPVGFETGTAVGFASLIVVITLWLFRNRVDPALTRFAAVRLWRRQSDAADGPTTAGAFEG